MRRFIEKILRMVGLIRGRRTPIAEAKEGELVQLRGEVRADGALLRSPLNNTPCLIWHAEVAILIDDDRMHGSGGYVQWRRLASDERSVDVSLFDPSGTAKVPGAKITFDRSPHDGWTSGAPPAAVVDFVAARGESSVGKLRWRETLLVPGQRIQVVGVARWVRDPTGQGGGYRSHGKSLCLDTPDLGWIEVLHLDPIDPSPSTSLK